MQPSLSSINLGPRRKIHTSESQIMAKNASNIPKDETEVKLYICDYFKSCYVLLYVGSELRSTDLIS